MADEQEKNQAGPRFRLPKLFSHAEAETPSLGIGEVAADIAVPLPGHSASHAPTSLAEAAPAATKSEPFEATPHAATQHAAGGRTSVIRGMAANLAAKKAATTTQTGANGSAPEASSETPGDAPMDMAAQFAAMHHLLEDINEQVAAVNERETALERVFDALHGELAGYKNDFLYEHLKPVVRPLLFLFDSLEQFDGEVAVVQAVLTPEDEDQSALLSPTTVRQNVGFFRDQLIEALRVCEVTIMDVPEGPFNAKLHKAVDVAPVPAEQDNTILRVVRCGWYLNGQLLRPADVVVGKHRG